VQLGVEDKVTFLGGYRYEELPHLFQRADIAVYPFCQTVDGDQEGLGLVVLEAMGCGLPVVVSDLPAVHDMITDGETGLLVPPQDASELAKAIESLIRNPVYSDRLSRAARRFAVEHFDWHNIAQRYAKLLTESGQLQQAASVNQK
jgi:glycosyltransferase involved in cell wall biosynthesis